MPSADVELIPHYTLKQQAGALIVSSIAPNPAWPGAKPSGLESRLLGYPVGTNLPEEQILFEMVMGGSHELAQYILPRVILNSNLGIPMALLLQFYSFVFPTPDFNALTYEDRAWITVAILRRSTNAAPPATLTAGTVHAGGAYYNGGDWRIMNDFIVSGFVSNSLTYGGEFIRPLAIDDSHGMVGPTPYTFFGPVVLKLSRLIDFGGVFDLELIDVTVNLGGFKVVPPNMNVLAECNDMIWGGMAGDTSIRHRAAGRAGFPIMFFEDLLLNGVLPPPFASDIVLEGTSSGNFSTTAIPGIEFEDAQCTWPTATRYAYFPATGFYSQPPSGATAPQSQSPWLCFIPRGPVYQGCGEAPIH